MTKPSVGRVERSGFAAWSPDETTRINGWTVASNGGFTRRLNSATTVGEADTSLATRDEIVAWLAERGSPPTIRVTPLVDSITVAGCLEAWGLVPVDRTSVMVADPRVPEPDEDVMLIDAADPAFVDELIALNGRDDASVAPWNRIVERIGDDATGVWIPGVAVGFVAVHDRVAPIFSVAVHDDHRRRGQATRIMNAAQRWAAQRGAEATTLQVVGMNDAARALYEGLGYAESYQYHYLQPARGPGVGVLA